MISKKRIYVSADDKIVEEGSPEAARLLVGEGAFISAEDVERYRVPKSALEGDEPAQEEPEKAGPGPSQDKARRASGDSVK